MRSVELNASEADDKPTTTPYLAGDRGRRDHARLLCKEC